MMHKGLLSAVVLLALQPLAGAEVSNTQGGEQELTAVLRAEILWNDTPRSFRAPEMGSASIAINALPDAISYCSHDLGTCARYSILGFRNWMRLSSAPCEGRNSDLDALVAFLGKGSIKPPGGAARPAVLGRGGLAGSPAPGSGIIWTTKIALGGRAEILKEYQQMHPADIDGLKSWLRSPATSHSGVRAITIACYSPFDPLVYYYVDRSAGAPVVMAVFWDKDRQEWIVAASFERGQSPEKFDEMRRTIESVPCSTVTFQ